MFTEKGKFFHPLDSLKLTACIHMNDVRCSPHTVVYIAVKYLCDYVYNSLVIVSSLRTQQKPLITILINLKRLIKPHNDVSGECETWNIIKCGHLLPNKGTNYTHHCLRSLGFIDDNDFIINLIWLTIIMQCRSAPHESPSTPLNGIVELKLFGFVLNFTL